MPVLSHTGLSSPSSCLLVRVGSSVSPAAIAILSEWEESIVASECWKEGAGRWKALCDSGLPGLPSWG